MSPPCGSRKTKKQAVQPLILWVYMDAVYRGVMINTCMHMNTPTDILHWRVLIFHPQGQTEEFRPDLTMMSSSASVPKGNKALMFM